MIDEPNYSRHCVCPIYTIFYTSFKNTWWCKWQMSHLHLKIWLEFCSQNLHLLIILSCWNTCPFAEVWPILLRKGRRKCGCESQFYLCIDKIRGEKVSNTEIGDRVWLSIIAWTYFWRMSQILSHRRYQLCVNISFHVPAGLFWYGDYVTFEFSNCQKLARIIYPAVESMKIFILWGLPLVFRPSCANVAIQLRAGGGREVLWKRGNWWIAAVAAPNPKIGGVWPNSPDWWKRWGSA